MIVALLTENPRFPFWLTAALDMEKAVDIGCTLLICFQALFFLLIRVPMRTNLVRHRFVMTLWWLASGASVVLFMPYFSSLGETRTIVSLAVANACCIDWALTLRRAGEKDPDRGSPLSEEEIERTIYAYKMSKTVQRELRGLGAD